MSDISDQRRYYERMMDEIAVEHQKQLAELQAENAELREVCIENAKLRELVRDMMRFFEDGDYCTICEKAAECESLEEYESDCLMRGVFKARMAELGIEVEQWATS